MPQVLPRCLSHTHSNAAKRDRKKTEKVVLSIKPTNLTEKGYCEGKKGQKNIHSGAGWIVLLLLTDRLHAGLDRVEWLADNH